MQLVTLNKNHQLTKEILSSTLTAFRLDKDRRSQDFLPDLEKQIDIILQAPFLRYIDEDEVCCLFKDRFCTPFNLDPYSENFYNDVEVWTRDNVFKYRLFSALEDLITTKLFENYLNPIVGYKVWIMKWKFYEMDCREDCAILFTKFIIFTAYWLVTYFTLTMLLQLLVKN